MNTANQACSSTEDQPHEAASNRYTDAMATLLDSIQEKLLGGDVLNAYRALAEPLTAIWAEASATAHADAVRQQCRDHPLYRLVHQDPYTNRATIKPRGYAGDAVMMDYIYHNEVPDMPQGIGSTIFSLTTRMFASLSVRYRRQLLRSLIDDTVARIQSARLLSVASGHARELQGSLVTDPLFGGEFIALDQDPLSCAEIERSQQGRPVRAIPMGVVDLLRSPKEILGSFDLIYSAGLYDYLSDSLAHRLTRRLLQMLKPDGRLVIANFVPDTLGRGYMELFMDWHLTFRDEAQLRQLAIDAGAMSLRSFLDPHRNVAYVEIRQQGATHTAAV